MDRFDGRRVFHTGGASGIGAATVHRLVDEGATVFTVDRSQEGLDAVKRAASAPDRVVTHTADLADESQVVRAAATGLEALGGVDVLINGAGFMAPRPASQAVPDEYRALFDVNFLAPVILVRELLPHLPDGRGVIVNVTSVAAGRAHPGMTGYAASKGALLAYSLSLAAELAPRRIRVVPISPGGIATPLTDAVAHTEGIDFNWYMRVFPLWGEMGEPAQAAAAIAFAASDDGSYFNGVELRVDGGGYT